MDVLSQEEFQQALSDSEDPVSLHLHIFCVQFVSIDDSIKDGKVEKQ